MPGVLPPVTTALEVVAVEVTAPIAAVPLALVDQEPPPDVQVKVVEVPEQILKVPEIAPGVLPTFTFFTW